MSAPPSDAVSAAEAAEGVRFIADDWAGSLARARRERKALFVDAWAPWCHTCLSMKHQVFTDPALAAYSNRVVFAALDTDRDENAAFRERYAINVWPTLLVVDPDSAQVIGYWPGAASARELRGFLDDGLAVLDASRSGKLEPGSPEALFAAAKAAQATADPARAASLYERAVAAAPAGWARRSEALFGWVEALYRMRDGQRCVRTGLAHLDEVTGSARPTDFAGLVLACTELLPAAQRSAPRTRLIARLRQLTEQPAPDASPDDRADTWHRLADALSAAGDRDGSRRAHEQRLVIMERAAREAPSPEAAATYDYGRASAYASLGRGEEALHMLAERERQMPTAYEPVARRASVLAQLERWPEALTAIDRALGLAYGPRRLRYLALKAKIQTALGDHDGAIVTLEEELRGHEVLKRTAADPNHRDATARLAAARARLTAPSQKNKAQAADRPRLPAR